MVELFKAVAIQLLQQLSAIAVEPDSEALPPWRFAPLKQWHCWPVNRASASLKPDSHGSDGPSDGPMACSGELQQLVHALRAFCNMGQHFNGKQAQGPVSCIGSQALQKGCRLLEVHCWASRVYLGIGGPSRACWACWWAIRAAISAKAQKRSGFMAQSSLMARTSTASSQL